MVSTTPGAAVRHCAIALRMGDHVACPADGCALLAALGAHPLDGFAEPCPVEMLVPDGPGELPTLATLNELRRTLERTGAERVRGWVPDRERHRLHQRALRRWPRV